MRILTLVIGSTVALAGLSTHALAQSRPGSMDLNGVPQNFTMRAGMQTATNNAARIQLAKKAAVMINEGHCPEALKLAQDAGETDIANRINQACAPVKQTAAR